MSAAVGAFSCVLTVRLLPVGNSWSSIKSKDYNSQYRVRLHLSCLRYHTAITNNRSCMRWCRLCMNTAVQSSSETPLMIPIRIQRERERERERQTPKRTEPRRCGRPPDRCPYSKATETDKEVRCAVSLLMLPGFGDVLGSGVPDSTWTTSGVRGASPERAVRGFDYFLSPEQEDRERERERVRESGG